MITNNTIAQWNRLKAMPFNDFVVQVNLPNAAEVYNAIQKALPGHVEIIKDGTGEMNYGYTPGFGEGCRCYIATAQQWYMTSMIQKINWEEGYFITLNSKYWFKFRPFEEAEEVKKEEENV